MSPITGGGGGGDTFTPFASQYFTYRIGAAVGNSDFLATIQGFTGVGGEVTYNAGFVGDADYLTPWDGWNQVGHLVLHNTTRSDYGLVGNHVPGTRTITLEDDVPATWAIGDTITLRSQECDIGGSPYLFDLYVGDVVPAEATVVYLAGSIAATVAGANFNVHPYETYGAGKLFGTNTFAANIAHPLYLPLPVVSQRFCFRVNATGANRATVVWFKLMGYELP